MNWIDEGFLIGKNRYSENSLIAELYTKDHGKISGIIFGGTSKKIKNYLQIGNKLHINFNSKTVNRIGYLKIEIDQALSPFYFDNKKKLACITSAMHLTKILTAESQINKLIFSLLENFYVLLKKDNWIKDYIFWELELFKIVGYDLDFKNIVDKQVRNNQLEYFAISSVEKKLVPNFLVEKNKNIEDLSTLLNGLKLVGDYLDKTILKPNNLTQPISRIQFMSTLKQLS